MAQTENRGPELASVAIVFLVTSWIFVTLRIFTRTRLIKSIGTDDWLIVLSLILFTCYASFVLSGVAHGTGKHMSELTMQQFSAALKTWWFGEIFYAATTCILKLSIGCFLLRVTARKIHIWMIWMIMALSLIYGTYMIFLVTFQCRPSSFFWNKAQTGHCVNSGFFLHSAYGHAAITALADWTFGILPAFIVYDLNMNRRTKISVGLLLCVANVGSIATLVRIKYLRQLAVTNDFIFATVDVAIWSTVEPGICIAAASIACLRPLFRSFFLLKIESSRSPITMPLNSVGRHQPLDGFENARPRCSFTASSPPPISIAGASSSDTWRSVGKNEVEVTARETSHFSEV